MKQIIKILKSLNESFDDGVYHGSSKLDREPRIPEIHNNAHISPDERKAFTVYNTPGYVSRMNYYAINNFHRGKITPNDDDHAKILKYTKDLDNAIGRHRLNEDTHVWRGLRGHAATEFLAARPGHVVSDNGFVSTSLSPGYAYDYGQRDDHIAHIMLPKGSKAISLNHYDFGFRPEREVLLPRNAKFRYLGNERQRNHRGGITTVHHLMHEPD